MRRLQRSSSFAAPLTFCEDRPWSPESASLALLGAARTTTDFLLELRFTKNIRLAMGRASLRLHSPGSPPLYVYGTTVYNIGKASARSIRPGRREPDR